MGETVGGGGAPGGSRQAAESSGSRPDGGPRAPRPQAAPRATRVPLSQFGLGFWQAWWTLAFCTDALAGPEALPGLPFDGHTLMFAVTTLGYLASLALSRRPGGLSYSPRACVGAAALCCSGSAGMAVASHLMSGAPASAAFMLATALFSLGNALLVSLWGELWGTLASGKVGRCLYTSYIIAFAVYFLLLPLPLAARAAVLAALPAVSCAVLALAQSEPRRDPRRSAPPQPLARGLALRALAAAFLLNLVWGAGLPALAGLDGLSGQEAVSAGFGVALCLLAGLLAYMVVEKPAVEAFALHTPVELSLGCGIVLALLLPGALSVLGYGVTVLGGACLDMLIMLVATDMAFRCGRPPAFVLSLSLLVARAGSLAGRTAGAALLGAGLLAPEQELLACVLAVMASGLAVFTPSALEGMYRTLPAPREGGGLDGRCLAFAREHALTARETEVLRLLVRGRSAPYIAQKLSIAQGTAKNHVSGIYRKAGVGDRQSLLNLVEQASPAGPPAPGAPAGSD